MCSGTVTYPERTIDVADYVSPDDKILTTQMNVLTAGTKKQSKYRGSCWLALLLSLAGLFVRQLLNALKKVSHRESLQVRDSFQLNIYQAGRCISPRYINLAVSALHRNEQQRMHACKITNMLSQICCAILSLSVDNGITHNINTMTTSFPSNAALQHDQLLEHLPGTPSQKLIHPVAQSGVHG